MTGRECSAMIALARIAPRVPDQYSTNRVRRNTRVAAATVATLRAPPAVQGHHETSL